MSEARERRWGFVKRYMTGPVSYNLVEALPSKPFEHTPRHMEWRRIYTLLWESRVREDREHGTIQTPKGPPSWAREKGRE